MALFNRFLAILAVEAVILAVHYPVETYEFKVFFLVIILITVFALSVFTIEGLLQIRRNHHTQQEKNQH